jgi:SAM-dependent methyltransferase
MRKPRQEIRSYASMSSPRGGLATEVLRLVRLWRNRTADLPQHVQGQIELTGEMKRRVRDWGQLDVSGLDVLEIGPGQLLAQMAVLAVDNRVTGIDLDVVPWGWEPRQYIRVWRQNGPKRFAKTIGRKVLGFDRSFRRELARQLGVAELPPVNALHMDATRTAFPDAVFDFIYSFDTFEHLAEPAPVLREAVRVLRPGGACYISLHPATAEDGFHDLRIIAGDRAGIPYWAHLRPPHRQEVQASSYLNELRLSEWSELFGAIMPGVRFHLDKVSNRVHTTELARLREAGELGDYTDDELLVSRFVAFWKKPRASGGGI